MGAVYHPSDFSKLYNQQFNAVQAWIKANPGKSVDACATALAIPYELVYAICTQSGMAILPSSSGEISFTHKWN